MPPFVERESVGGRAARFWRLYSAGTYYSGVSFEDPKVFVQGVAADERGLAVHQALYRTVCFP